MDPSLEICCENRKNLSAVLYGKDDLRLESTPFPPEIDEDDVLLMISKVGICGSDVHLWTNGYIGPFTIVNPLITGHEASGQVISIGDGVTHLKVGDRVAIEPSIPCLRGEDCRQGSYNICPHTFFSSAPPYDGLLTKYVKWPADFCYKLPDNVSDEEGALVEPLSVALHASNRANIRGGDIVLICGAGPIGLLNLLVSKAFGVTRICITDFNESRLEIAKSLGATATVVLREGQSQSEIKNKIIQELGRMPDKVFECSGAEAGIRLTIEACKDGGKVILIGCGPNEVTVPVMSIVHKELDIGGSFKYKNTWPKAIELISSGMINVKPLITHQYKLEQTLEAFGIAKRGQGIKVMIDCMND